MTMLYHYSASYQSQAGSLINIDGVLTCKDYVDSMSRYSEIKAAISSENSHRLTIHALSVLPSGKAGLSD